MSMIKGARYVLRVKAGVNILQNEEDFILGILGVFLGRIPGFYWNDHKILTILKERQLFKGKITVF